MPKSTKRFVINTDAVNGQGFRMLTSGVVLDEFEKNPLLLWNHIRPEGNATDQVLPLGYWDEIELKDGQLTGVPVFDDNDAFAMKIYNKVEHGTIRMCSAGAEPIETSKEKNLLLTGQTRETVTRWRLKEASLCDIGANPESLAVQLYDADGCAIKLSSNQIPKIQLMADAKNEKPAEKPDEKLNDDTPKTEAPKKEDLNDSDKDKELKRLQDKVEELTKRLNDAEGEKKKSEVKNLVSLAETEGRITKAQVPHFEKLALADLEGTKALIGTLEKHVSLKSQFQGSAPSASHIEKLAEKSWDDLFRSGELETVKLSAPDVYANIYRNKFGKDPR